MKLCLKNCLLAITFAFCVFQSCTKKEDTTTPVPSDNQETIYSKNQTDDNRNVESSVDNALNDIDNQLNSMGARIEACDFSSTTVTGSDKKITFTFNGSSCDGINTRSGEIVVSLISGSKYSDVGSVWRKQYKNLVITKFGKSLTLNGDIFLTNVSGGYPGRVLLGLPNVVYKIKSSNMNLKLDTTTSTRQWNLARKYTYSNVAGETTLSIEGDTTIGSYTKLILWGKNRFGQDFYTQLPTSAIFGLKCLSRPISATRKHTIERSSGNIVSDETVTTSTTNCKSTYSVTVNVNSKSYSYTGNY